MQTTSSWVAPVVAAVIVVIVALPLAGTLNVWIDEAYTIHSTGRGVAYALHETTAFELQPPLYFVFLAAWRLIDEGSVLFARVPSIVFAAGAAACIVVAARRTAPSAPPIVVAVVTGLNPVVLWAAVEMRVYALVLLIAAVLVLGYLDGFVALSPSRRAQIAYGVAALAGLYTQYYLAFVMFACVLVLLVANRRALPALIIVNAAASALFLPYVPTALAQVHAAVGGDVMHVSAAKALHEMFNANFIYLLPHELGWAGAVKATGFLAAAVLVVAVLALGRPRIDWPARAIAGCWVAATLTYSAAFTLSGEALDVRKHAIAVAPLALLTAYAVVSSLTRRGQALAAASIAVYALFTAGSLWYAYRPPASKPGDWKRVAAFVDQTDPPAPVIIFPANLALAFGRYLPPRERLVPLPAPMAFRSDYLTQLRLHDEAQVAQAFRMAHITGSVWIVTDNSCDPRPQTYDFACTFLHAYLRARYEPVRRAAFRGSVATLYMPRS